MTFFFLIKNLITECYSRFFLTRAISLIHLQFLSPLPLAQVNLKCFVTQQFCFSLIIDQVKYRPKLSVVNESDPTSKETKGLVSQCLFTKLEI